MAPKDFADALRRLLPLLYDPSTDVPDVIDRALLAGGIAEPSSARDHIIAQIEVLRPGPRIPQTARVWRLYQILHLRYVEQWTQPRVAAELGITVRHLAREQARAIAFLAERLWRLATKAPQPPSTDQSALQQSLAALGQGTKQTAVDLAGALRRTCHLVQVVAEKHQVEIAMGPSAPGIMVSAHPSVLSQILVRSLTRLVSNADLGQVLVSALTVESQGISRMVASRYVGSEPLAEDLLEELVHSQLGELRARREGPRASLEIAFPLAPKRVVLVVDDNADLIHYYRQCVANAPYEIHGLAEGARVVERAKEIRPDIIVLDLMLPDADGWEVLEELKSLDSLSSIPVIISSVVREEELAIALGATLCLAKPVRRAEFVAALNKVLSL